MNIRNVPFESMGWAKVPAAERKGEEGTSFWHVRETGNVRVRMVDDSAGCRADNWDSRGHVPLGRGMGFQAAARAFFVD